MTKKLKMVLIASVLMGSFSYSYAGWLSFSTHDKAKDAYSEGKHSDALLLYEQACNEGHFESCNDAGSMYENGMGTSKSNTIAKSFYKIACNNNAGNGCSNLQSVEKGITAFNDALRNCYAGSADWCGQMGYYYYKGEIVKQNLDRSAKYLQEACDAGQTKWCGWLASLYNDKKDYFKAFEYYSKACDAGSAVGCVSVGYSYENALGARLDLAKATDFYGKGCDMKNQHGCESYKRLKSPQPVQQVVNNNPNSDYQRQQLDIQRQQLKLQKEQNLQNQLNSMQQQNQFQSQQNAQYLRNLGY